MPTYEELLAAGAKPGGTIPPVSLTYEQLVKMGAKPGGSTPPGQKAAPFALGKTSISENPRWSSALRQLFNLAPDIGEAIGMGVGMAPAAAPGGVAATPLSVPAGMILGRAGGESAKQNLMNLIRPEWMDKPSFGEQLEDIGKAGVQGGVDVAAGIVLGGTGKILTARIARSGIVNKSASELTRVLHPGAEERQFISRLVESLSKGDIASEARLTNMPIKNASTLEVASSNAVRTLDEKIGEFWKPYAKYPESFTIDGNKIADAIIRNIPESIRIEKPGVVKNIIKEANWYRRQIGFQEARTILAEKNAANASYHKAAPGEQYKMEMQRKYLTDTAVADTIRSEWYPRVAELAGPGMDELMRRQGIAIQVRNLAHKLADAEAVEGGWVVKHFPSVQLINPKLGIARETLRWWESPNKIIKNIFKKYEISSIRPSYPKPQHKAATGILPSAPIQLGPVP